jgi:uncharacterized protein (TIGR02611 family)
MADRHDVVKRHARRVAVTIAGGVVVVVGALLSLPLVPGPGLLVIAAGLAILATEYPWARRLLVRARQAARRTFDRARGRGVVERKGPELSDDASDDDRDAA